MPIARSMNLDLIWVHEASTVLEHTIAHSLNAAGTPCLVVEMGVGMRVTPAFAEQLTTGILHVARALGALDADLELEPTSHAPLVADDGNVQYLNAAVSGMFVPCVEHWIAVRRGESTWKLQLRPPSLGRLEVHLTTGAKGLEIVMRTETVEA